MAFFDKYINRFIDQLAVAVAAEVGKKIPDANDIAQTVIDNLGDVAGTVSRSVVTEIGDVSEAVVSGVISQSGGIVKAIVDGVLSRIPFIR